MIKIIGYLPEHLENIKLRSCHDGEKPAQINGEAITFLIGDEPIAIFGWYYVTPGVVQVWGLLSESIQKKKKSFHKAVRLFVVHGFEAYSLRRMQMSVRVGYRMGWDWSKALGFSCEGVMKKYGPNGEDYWLFARVSS